MCYPTLLIVVSAPVQQLREWRHLPSPALCGQRVPRTSAQSKTGSIPLKSKCSTPLVPNIMRLRLWGLCRVERWASYPPPPTDWCAIDLKDTSHSHLHERVAQQRLASLPCQGLGFGATLLNCILSSNYIPCRHSFVDVVVFVVWYLCLLCSLCREVVNLTKVYADMAKELLCLSVPIQVLTTQMQQQQQQMVMQQMQQGVSEHTHMHTHAHTQREEEECVCVCVCAGGGGRERRRERASCAVWG